MIYSCKTLLTVLLAMESLLNTEVNDKVNFVFKVDLKHGLDQAPKRKLENYEIPIPYWNSFTWGISLPENNEKNPQPTISFDKENNCVTLEGSQVAKFFIIKILEVKKEDIQDFNGFERYEYSRKTYPDWPFYESDTKITIYSEELLNELSNNNEIDSEKNLEALITFSTDLKCEEESKNIICEEYEKFSTEKIEVPIKIIKSEGGKKNIEVDIKFIGKKIKLGLLKRDTESNFEELFKETEMMNEEGLTGAMDISENEKDQTEEIPDIDICDKSTLHDSKPRQSTEKRQKEKNYNKLREKSLGHQMDAEDHQPYQKKPEAALQANSSSSGTSSDNDRYPSAINTTSDNKFDAEGNPISRFIPEDNQKDLNNKSSSDDEEDEKDGFKMPLWGWALIAIFVIVIVFFLMKFIYSENPDEE